MYYDIGDTDDQTIYKLMVSTVTPRPIAWVTTQSPDGALNAAPYSFFNAMGPNPPPLALGLMHDPARGRKDTARNILDTGEFVVNLVPRALAEAMNVTAIDAPAQIDELALAGLSTLPSTKVSPPRIDGSPVQFECSLLSGVATGPKQMVVLGRIEAIHIADDKMLDPARNYVDTRGLDLVARLEGSQWYQQGGERFEMSRPVFDKDR